MESKKQALAGSPCGSSICCLESFLRNLRPSQRVGSGLVRRPFARPLARCRRATQRPESLLLIARTTSTSAGARLAQALCHSLAVTQPKTAGLPALSLQSIHSHPQRSKLAKDMDEDDRHALERRVAAYSNSLVRRK